MRHVSHGIYKGLPQRFVPVFDRHPELFAQVRALYERGVALLDDDTYGAPPDAAEVEQLIAGHRKGAVPTAVLRHQLGELRRSRLKWELARLCLAMESDRGTTALMLRADEPVDLADAAQALARLDVQLAHLEQHLAAPSAPESRDLSPALSEARIDVATLARSEGLSDRLRASASPLHDALALVLAVLPVPATLDELAALTSDLVPAGPDFLVNLKSLLEDRRLLAVALRDGRYVAAASVVDGVKLRLVPAGEEIAEGYLALEHHLPEFLLTAARDDFTLLDRRGKDVVQATYDLGRAGTVAEVGGWYRREGLDPGDDIIVTALDFSRRAFLIEREPAAARDEDAIRRVTAKLTARLAAILAACEGGSGYLHQVLPTAWAAVPEVRQTAAEPLSLIVLGDERFDLIEGSILALTSA